MRRMAALARLRVHARSGSSESPPSERHWGQLRVVITGKPHNEHNESGLHPLADMERTFREVREGPILLQKSFEVWAEG